MDENAAESFVNAPHSVYGLRLRPYCLLHSIQLRAILSHAPSGPMELWFAAQICAGNSDQIELRKLPLWRALRHRYDEQAARWAAYVLDYYAGPELWSSGGQGKAGAPFEISVATWLMRELGWSRQEAWTAPIGIALWHQASAYDQTSTKETSCIVSETDRRMMEKLRN